MTYTVEDLLNQVQELIGEAPGDFYNISSRLRDLNTAQEEMVVRARALPTEGEVTVTQGEASYNLPKGFLTFGRFKPQFESITGERRPLTVVSERVAEEQYPNWRDERPIYGGTPEFMVRSGGQVHLFPTPNRAGRLILPYIERPELLEDVGDEAFGGDPDLQRFAPGLAYYAANVVMQPRAPQTAQQYYAIYESYARRMVHHLRDSPQRKSFRKVVPIRTWS